MELSCLPMRYETYVICQSSLYALADSPTAQFVKSPGEGSVSAVTQSGYNETLA